METNELVSLLDPNRTRHLMSGDENAVDLIWQWRWE